MPEKILDVLLKIESTRFFYWSLSGKEDDCKENGG